MEQEILRFGIGIAFLFICVIEDIKKRHVNLAWYIIFGVIGLGFFFAFGSENSELEITWYLIIFFLFVGGLLLTHFIGLGDLLTVPIIFLIFPQADMAHTPFSYLTNAFIFSIIIIPMNFFRNYLRSRKENIFENFDATNTEKIKAMLIGKVSSGNDHGYRIETMQNRKRKFIFHSRNTDKFQINKVKGIWIANHFPFMVFIFMGFIYSAISGDIIIQLLGEFPFEF